MVTIDQVLPLLDTYKEPNVGLFAFFIGFSIAGAVSFVLTKYKLISMCIALIGCVVSTVVGVGLPQRTYTINKAEDIVEIVKDNKYRVLPYGDGYVMHNNGISRTVVVFGQEQTVNENYIIVKLSINEAIKLEKLLKTK